MTPTEGGLVGICGQVLKLAIENMKEGDASILLTHYPARLPDQSINEGFYFEAKAEEKEQAAAASVARTRKRKGKKK